ncbi:MAG: hypothetical protein F6J90_29975 [Moorea sp. SIOASIH]|uniref:Uncharacterized protein n=1 Tax=Moorena producens (strain JHB) TaxID=1454205 RepID=A0A9Q9SUE6_MOOP1|nr:MULTISPECIES: hypothetical protein [Moorena]NEO40344.1 hypothetical protein [Moorena sp. SIOASIH]WAN69837.1 hypothetical protein BJP36_37735 [Moorena producens JHB]
MLIAQGLTSQPNAGLSIQPSAISRQLILFKSTISSVRYGQKLFGVAWPQAFS